MIKYRIMFNVLRGYYIQEYKRYFFWLFSRWKTYKRLPFPYSSYQTEYYITKKAAQYDIDSRLEHARKSAIPDKIISYHP